jgi:hypothetical protein
MTKRLYTYYPEFDENDFLLWKVYETMTNQVVGEFVFEDEAQEYMEKLESGFAFAGYTPSFILRKVPTDINDAFAAEFA